MCFLSQLIFTLLGCVEFVEFMIIAFRKCSAVISSNIISVLSTLCWDFNYTILDHLIFFHGLLTGYFSVVWIVGTALFSHLLIFSSALFKLLLSPFGKLFTSDVVFSSRKSLRFFFIVYISILTMFMFPLQLLSTS